MDSHSKIWYFENLSLIEMLTPSERKLMAEMAIMRDAPKNQVLYFPEDSANSVFLLKKGRVKISRISDQGKEMILGLLGPGDIFGELSLTGQSTREEIAEVTEDAVICKIDTQDFEKVLELNPKFNIHITKFIGFRLKKIQSRLENLLFKTSEERVRFFIKEMGQEYGRKILNNPNQRHLDLKLTHEDIAKLAATSRQTVTSVFSELEKQGLIKYDRKRIFIKDLEAL